MYSIQRISLGWTLVTMLFAGLSQPVLAAAQSEWQVTELRGSAEWKPDSSSEWQTLRIGDSIRPPVHVRTGRDGRATLRRGADNVKISPNSLLFFPVAESREDGVFIRILQRFGVVSYEVEKRPNPGFQVETAYLTSLVKGTVFEVASSADQSAVTLLSGSLLVSKPDNSESVLIRPYQTASVSKQHPQIRITTLHKGSGRKAPQDPSASLVGSDDDSAASVNDDSTFSWARDVGLETVTQTVTHTASSAGAVESILTGLEDTVSQVTHTVEGLELNADLQLPVGDVGSAGLSVPGGVDAGSNGIPGVTGLAGDSAVEAGGIVGDTVTQSGSLLNNPIAPGDLLPAPIPGEPLQDITGSLGL